MKKVGTYLAFLFAGFSAGLIAMYKIMGDTVKIEVKRIKNKRVGSSEVNIPIDIESPKTKRKSRKERKNGANKTDS